MPKVRHKMQDGRQFFCILQEREKDGQDEIRARIKSPSIKLIEQIEILGNLVTKLHKVKLIHD